MQAGNLTRRGPLDERIGQTCQAAVDRAANRTAMSLDDVACGTLAAYIRVWCRRHMLLGACVCLFIIPAAWTVYQCVSIGNMPRESTFDRNAFHHHYLTLWKDLYVIGPAALVVLSGLSVYKKTRPLGLVGLFLLAVVALGAVVLLN